MSKALKSIKTNLAYNTLLKALNIIFPLITFPYVARVLSPDGVGKVDFSISIIQYFILLAQVGIPIYAVRECAKVRDDHNKLEKTVQEILLINTLTLILSYFIFGLIIFNVEKLFVYRKLLLIGSINILSTSIGVEWFYQAVEEYKYITIRSIFVKIISLISIFIFIKDENDFIVYALITVLSNALGYFYNFVHLNKYINIFKNHKIYDFKRHLKPILLLFAMSLSVSIYVSLDKVMIGFISGDASVGLYTAANKTVKVILALITSLGTVLLPRMSYYIENNETDQIMRLIKKSLDFILMISIPSTIGIFVLAKPIILLFAGENYLGAVSTIKIISPIIVAIGLSNLIGIQILISNGKEKITLISTIIGAVINFSLNLLLIPILNQNGAAIGTLVAEISVILFQLIFVYSYLKGAINWKSIISYLVGGVLIILLTSIIEHFLTNMIVYTISSVLISVIAYLGFLYLIKNQLVFEMTNRVFLKFKNKLTK